jgi:hypothetical protein
MDYYLSKCIKLADELIGVYKDLTLQYKHRTWVNRAYIAFVYESIFHPFKARSRFITIMRLLRREEYGLFKAMDEIAEEMKAW